MNEPKANEVDVVIDELVLAWGKQRNEPKADNEEEVVMEGNWQLMQRRLAAPITMDVALASMGCVGGVKGKRRAVLKIPDRTK